MSSVHGADLFVSVDAVDLSAFVKTSSWDQSPDIHDISGSGSYDKRHRGGQIARTFTMGGWFDSDETDGPAFLEALGGTTTELVYQVYGTGTGRPQRTADVVVGKYVVSTKNDDISQWTCDFTVDGAVDATPQA